MSEFIVKNVAGQFLSISRDWCNEYPDAEIFSKKKVAIMAAERTKVLCEVIEDYGVETERVIDTVGPKAA